MKTGMSGCRRRNEHSHFGTGKLRIYSDCTFLNLQEAGIAMISAAVDGAVLQSRYTNLNGLTSKEFKHFRILLNIDHSS